MFGINELNPQNLFNIVTSFIGTLSVIASITPSQSDNKFINIAYKAIDFLGCNFFNAKNEKK